MNYISKSLYALLLLCTFSINTKQKFNRKKQVFYTVPAAPNINQEEYHKLCIDCANIIRKSCFLSGECDDLVVAINLIAYLKSVDTPTAHRLLKDFHLE